MEDSRPSASGVTGWKVALGFASGCYLTSDTFNLGLGSAICLRALPPNSTCITSETIKRLCSELTHHYIRTHELFIDILSI
uniref:Uncharacterized protein n=1 Tax=Amphimedon queenslandica TaxID=400682 RepID=A0A1X7V419_AMPQE